VKRVGILGGGQLGTMLASAVHDLGGLVTVFDPDPAAPACLRFRDVINAPWTDAEALERLFRESDVVTYEFEHIETQALRRVLERRGAAPIADLAPSASVLETAQDRAREKDFLRSSGLPHVDYAVVHGRDGLLATARSFGFPLIVKTARGGYDGKGQYLVASEDELEAVAARLPPGVPYVLEEVLDLALEASCIVGRSPDGVERAFPVFENVHAGHILDVTLFPARVPEELATTLQRLALDAARALDVTGLLTTEFFVTKRPAARSRGIAAGGLTVYVNELAPRPHNSGHVTRTACHTSQFQLLARILLGLPLGPAPSLVGPGAFCMGNLLGDVWLAQCRRDLDLSTLASHPDVVEVVLYGKREAQARRKMGHFVTRGDDAERAAAAARAFRASLLTPR